MQKFLYDFNFVSEISFHCNWKWHWFQSRRSNRFSSDVIQNRNPWHDEDTNPQEKEDYCLSYWQQHNIADNKLSFRNGGESKKNKTVMIVIIIFREENWIHSFAKKVGTHWKIILIPNLNVPTNKLFLKILFTTKL